MAFRFNAIDPSTGYEQWFDPTTGAYQLRPPANDPAPTTVTTTQSQSTSQQTPPGPIAYGPPQTQTFDDGSTLTTNVDGTVSSTDSPSPTAASTPGAGAATDDNSNGANTTSGINSILNTATAPGSLITPQSNVLDQFASYTYNIGWYLLTPDQARAVSEPIKIDVTQWSLLVQSGGAGLEQTGIFQTGTAAASLNPLVETVANRLGLSTLSTTGRNKYFTYDYYLDDLEIQIPFVKEAGATVLSFTVQEPYGLTLLPNLMNAVNDLYKQDAASASNAQYCLVIKFYGWDAKGNLISSPTQNEGIPGITPSVSNAVVTRYYPFQIIKLDFKQASKGVSYQISGSCQNFVYAKSSATGSIPFNFELTGTTVGEVLTGSGKGVGSAVKAPATDGREGISTSSPAPIRTTFDTTALTESTPTTATYNADGSVNAADLSGWSNAGGT